MPVNSLAPHQDSQRRQVGDTRGEPVLRLQDLTTRFATANGTVRAVNGVSYEVYPSQTLGIVGESGSGKSVTVLSALGLAPASATVSGHAWFQGRDLLAMNARELRQVRGGQIGMIFQDPMTALNPVMTIGTQIEETLRRHSTGLTRAQRADRVVELLTEVGIPAPKERRHQYPHQFSGGMRQRAMIAMALANRPALLIADEPTTALDVTVQAQILELLMRLQQEYGTALVLITHDLGVIAEVAERVVVMYSGRVVECAGVDEIFHATRHPYTAGLLGSLPRVDGDREGMLPAIVGQPPDPRRQPTGCAFLPRCHIGVHRTECSARRPELRPVEPDHVAACHFDDAVTRGGRAGQDSEEAR